MNMILLFDSDFVKENVATLTGRRFDHIKTIHKAEIGDCLKVGLLNDKIGTGEIIAKDDVSVSLKIKLNETPPPPLNTILILAMPRPLMFKRILMHICSMGVKELHLIHTKRVEKSFWGSPVLEEENILNELYLGLEQAVDTILPKVTIHKRFMEFIKNEGIKLVQNNNAYIAHPGLDTETDINASENSVIAIGPEGGFIDHEVEKFIELGFKQITLGQRILRVETAVPVAISKILNP